MPTDAASGTPHGTTAPSVGRHPRSLDVDPETGKTTDPGPASPGGAARGFAARLRPTDGLAGVNLPQLPEALRGFLERVNGGGGLQPGLGGLGMRAPAQAPDPLPEGAQFVTGSFTNAAGTRAYKLYVPSPTAARLCRLSSCCTAAPSRPTTSPPARG